MTIHPALEELRRSYRPDEIRVLFVGESPPAGGTFFYKGDSNLARYTEEAFSRVFDRTFERSEDFLQAFQSLGCYLDDLCLIPINKLTRAERKWHRSKSIPSLAARIRTDSPDAIVVVMQGIRRCVQQAAGRAGLDPGPVYSVPFPAMGHQQQYVAQLEDVLRRFQEAGTLPPHAIGAVS
jgi:hypothetical protein